MLAAIFVAFFCFSTIVQWNDPDAVWWAALYAAAAVVTTLVTWRGLGPTAPTVIAVVALIWSLALLPTAIGASFPELFRTWKMMSPEMEVGREELGLVIVAAWMLVLRRRALRQVG
jgi:hypothetical protein